ncbi:MAG: NADPH-dependent F420 reductase [Acidobacteriaceae bacterium]|nr:NADPH-dependent F420 reductase [Acidobacteriaceae bacterium]
MKIGIIGSGNVGGTLGKRWAHNGHQIVFSSRHPQSEEMKKLVAEAGANASAATIAETVKTNDLLLLATPWPATQDALKNAGNLAGKVLIDATNPLLPRLAGLEIGTTTSGAEQVASWAPGARVVKAFNTVGFNIMENPNFEGQPVLFYCGDDADAKQTVHQLISDLGFDTQDTGPLKQARLLEPFAMLWVSLAIKNGREFAFQLLKR